MSARDLQAESRFAALEMPERALAGQNCTRSYAAQARCFDFALVFARFMRTGARRPAQATRAPGAALYECMELPYYYYYKEEERLPT
jgi:hypothetical protein